MFYNRVWTNPAVTLWLSWIFSDRSVPGRPGWDARASGRPQAPQASL